MTTEIKELMVALNSARKEFKPLGINGFNPHFKSEFSTMADIEDATLEALERYELLFTHSTEIVLNGAEVIHVVKSVLYHLPSGQHLVSVTPIKAKNAQEIGVYMTYLIRYHTRSMLSINRGQEDNDGNSSEQVAARFTPKAASKPVDTVVAAKPASTPVATPTSSKPPLGASKKPLGGILAKKLGSKTAPKQAGDDTETLTEGDMTGVEADDNW